MTRLLVLPGDGIGPEVTDAGLTALDRAAKLYGFASLEVEEADIGGVAIDRTGEPLPEDTVSRAKAADAVLLGAVGGPKWDEAPKRPEAGLLGLRSALGVFANLRPIRLIPALADRSPLRAAAEQPIDFIIVRELIGGAYFGAKTEGTQRAEDVMAYSGEQVDQVSRAAFALAKARGCPVQLVDKANVLATSRLWRNRVAEVAREFPGVSWAPELVDSCAYRMVAAPWRYSVLLTENLFGDILSDLGAGLVGSLGLLPSASLGTAGPGLYEPVHGSAPDIAGQGIANPAGMLLTVAMLLEHGLKQERAAKGLRRAVENAYLRGRTADLCRPGEAPLSTGEFTRLVLALMEEGD